MKYIILFVALWCGSFTNNATAQTKPATIAKSKLPKLVTSLAQYKDSVGLTPEQIYVLIGMPLQVTDDKKVPFKLSSYRFLYKRKGVSETEDGKVIPATSMATQIFTTTPLPEIWVKTIIEQMKKGEELIFMEVVVKDARGKAMYAPDLKITIL